jgi:Htaa
MSGSVPEAPRQWSRSAFTLLGFALLSCGLVTGLSAFAYADPGAQRPAAMQVVGGRLDWGLTQAFQTESVRPSITVGDGAVQGRDGTIEFPSAGGTYDSAAGVATMKYRGTAALTYPAGRVTVTNPTVVIDRTGTALRADLGTAASQPPAGRLKQADMGAMNMSGVVPQTAARTLTWPQVPTTLTATGATAFPDGFEGAFLGPVTFAATLAAPSAPDANAVRAPNAPSPSAVVPNLPLPELPAPNARPNAVATTGTATPGVSECPSSSPSSSPSQLTTPSPADTTPSITTSADPAATSCPTSDTQSSTPAAPKEKLAKTGGPLAPLALAGVVLTVAGGATMISARRRAH